MCLPNVFHHSDNTYCISLMYTHILVIRIVSLLYASILIIHIVSWLNEIYRVSSRWNRVKRISSALGMTFLDFYNVEVLHAFSVCCYSLYVWMQKCSMQLLPVLVLLKRQIRGTFITVFTCYKYKVAGIYPINFFMQMIPLSSQRYDQRQDRLLSIIHKCLL